ncbi:related to IES2 Protein that associates with the INO80 chromatin remodeling complex under low-salt conditions [Phialocephala subalpina]|uniref:Related to IES2 Protein that associates with the INO80 chromatin remodeling complex under low-salt conditions n=1 Tax=Phialocephala subalpina TaxID=576137 RepID=A0A1L7WJD3_9HELO|nr:related to IES2 Protein that associates with the INO80 chromatin remodeling complex under low-salt conditions [Phialocephala subalpina]
MSNRPSKKLRRLSTDSEGTEDAYDWVGLKGSSQSRTGRAEKATAGKSDPSRPRRTASENVSSATVSRGPPSSSSSKSPQSIRLTVKTSSSKLREATRASSSGISVAVNSRDGFVGGEILEGKRARNVRKSYAMPSDSEEDEDEEMEDAADEDAEGESVDEEDEDMDAEDDGLGDEDADGDVDMDVPPPPVIKISKAQSGKQTITAKAASKNDQMSVEQKEMQEDSDDDDLSDLGSVVGEEVEEEEAMQTGNEEDVEGDEDEEEVEEAEDDEEEEDSDDETPAGGSRASTPNLALLTKRQRARLEEGGSGHLLALPDEVQVKKHLTAEEHAMRRAEMARRRKNLSEKRNEEEKMETINKLLKKQAPKTNARRRDMNAVAGESTPDSEAQKPSPLFVRWISNKDGNRIAVPEEWLEGPAGSMFANSVGPSGGLGRKLIEEVS